MELTLPETWNLSLEILAAFLSCLTLAVWASASAYRKIMGEIHAIREDIAAMKDRNAHADQETEQVKQKQAEQETTVAVMAERVGHLVEGSNKMQTTLDEILKELRAR